jgi:hypothetical protein
VYQNQNSQFYPNVLCTTIKNVFGLSTVAFQEFSSFYTGFVRFFKGQLSSFEGHGTAKSRLLFQSAFGSRFLIS